MSETLPLEMPRDGGSYTRNTDGSLTLAEPTTQSPAPQAAEPQAPEPDAPPAPARKKGA